MRKNNHLKSWIVKFLLLGVMLSYFINSSYADQPKIDLVKVFKSERRLELWSGNARVHEFTIALGFEPVGHKQKEGDGKTPEGRYVLDFKNAKSGYFKSIHISYPKAQDKEKAKALGVSPGGDVMIHGQRNGFGWLSWLVQLRDWTHGCIALKNSDMQIVWDLVETNTPIDILQ